ncbi:MAG: septal ring lytic transglycosylase RlpA family protein [Patescibacteria group bacterium]
MTDLNYPHLAPETRKKSFATAITLGLLIFLIFGLGQLGNATIKTIKAVTVSINGLTDIYTTKATEVGDLIAELNIQEPIVAVTPRPESRLTAATLVTVTTKPTDRNSIVAANMQATIDKVAADIKKQEEALKVPKSPVREGYASWYVFGNGMNTASREFPRGTKVHVIAIKSGKSVDVVVNDFGPEDWTGMSLDLNHTAFAKLAPLGAGIINVRYYKI